nr:PREDICTED: uncharacterized protein LOC109039955 isoform X2 [Bemisia tabaci]XP_018911251.1 PREDICTED: uncharacterized protein LOC109039955 isoform X2 [Bemisia tabaci]
MLGIRVALVITLVVFGALQCCAQLIPSEPAVVAVEDLEYPNEDLGYYSGGDTAYFDVPQAEPYLAEEYNPLDEEIIAYDDDGQALGPPMIEK